MTKETRRQWITWSLVVVGWFAAPIVKAWVEGTPLNGLRGIFGFWKSVLLYGVPLWLVIVICLALYFGLSFIHRQKAKKAATIPDLSVVVSDMPKPGWNIGANASVPHLSLRMSAQLTCRNEMDVIILKAYLEGTKPTGPFFEVPVPKSRSTRADLFFNVLPIIAKERQQLTRRVILLDQYGHEHVTEPVSFAVQKPLVLKEGLDGTVGNCLICSKSIISGEQSLIAAFPAHKNCAK